MSRPASEYPESTPSVKTGTESNGVRIWTEQPEQGVEVQGYAVHKEDGLILRSVCYTEDDYPQCVVSRLSITASTGGYLHLTDLNGWGRVTVHKEMLPILVKVLGHLDA